MSEHESESEQDAVNSVGLEGLADKIKVDRLGKLGKLPLSLTCHSSTYVL